MIGQNSKILLMTTGLGVVLALSGCPGSERPTTQNDAALPRDGGTTTPDTGTTTPDTGTTRPDTGTTTPDTGTTTPDAGAPVDANVAPDMGLASTWDNCGDAVVFGSDGEACSFTGSCTECVLTPAPRIALCMAGHLRVQAAGPGACAVRADAGTPLFPDSGPAPDAGAGVDGGTCGPFTVAAPTTAACSMSVVDCIRTGGTIGTCVSAEAACLDCVQRDIQACATTTGGCDDEAGLASCCFQASCPDGSCSGTTCAAPWNAYVSCVTASSCGVSDTCFPVPPACPALSWPAPTAVSCTAETGTCFDAAADGTARLACLDADTTPPMGSCHTCFNDAVISCVTDTGMCTSELGNAQCCIDAVCPTGEATCVSAALDPGGACETPWSTFFDCVNAALGSLPAGSCSVSACFP